MLSSSDDVFHFLLKWHKKSSRVHMDSQKRVILVYAAGIAIVATVRMIEMPRFSVAKLLLHHYKSDLAHTSDRCSSVIELYLSEI